MIVFDLKCYDRGHVFEGWFGSSADYEKQRASGMIACPVCGDTQVRKAVMSPAVSAKSNQRDTGASIPTRSEEHTSELQSLMRISYAVFCLKKKNKHRETNTIN